MKIKMLIAALAISGMTSAQTLKSGIDKANMNLEVKPGEDFYQFAAGGWLKSHPLDAVHPMNGSFTDLDEQNNDRIRDLVKEYAEKHMDDRCHQGQGHREAAQYAYQYRLSR